MLIWLKDEIDSFGFVLEVANDTDLENSFGGYDEKRNLVIVSNPARYLIFKLEPLN